MRLFLVLLLAGLGWSASQSCPVYQCDGVFLNPDGCAKQEMINGLLTYSLRVCNGSKAVCNIVSLLDEEDRCASGSSLATQYPGEYCRTNSECYSGSCFKSVCEGEKVNASCLSSADCLPGLQCLYSKCAPANKPDEECWFNTCQANSVCNGTHCVLIGSKSIGELASVPGECSSFFVYEGRCTKGPRLKREGNKDSLACPASNVCNYTCGEGHFRVLDCVCGMTKSGSKYCNPGQGDVDLSDVHG